MNIIVTGCCGLVGSNFCNYVLENYHKCIIYGIDNLSGGYIEYVPQCDNFKFFKLDLTDKNSQNIIEEDIFKKNKIDYIFHFAAYAAEGLSPFIRQYNYISNIIPTVFLINMGIKYNLKRFVFTSSMATYGENDVPYTEDMIPNPIDSYGIGKYACEMDLKAAYKHHNMEYCILKPHNIYGKNQNIWDPYRNVLGIWMCRVLNNMELNIYGDGEQTRAFSYIEDILPCIWNAAVLESAKNEIYNIGGINYISLNDAIKMVVKITGVSKDKIKYLEERYEIKHSWCTCEKSIKYLGYKENTTLEDGLKKMWEWAKTQPKRDIIYWDKYELDKGIYSYWTV